MTYSSHVYGVFIIIKKSKVNILKITQILFLHVGNIIFYDKEKLRALK